MPKKTKVVVTGGAGFIGSNLVDALVTKNFDVHIIDNLSAGKKENINKKAKFHLADITDLKKIQPFFNYWRLRPAPAHRIGCGGTPGGVVFRLGF